MDCRSPAVIPWCSTSRVARSLRAEEMCTIGGWEFLKVLFLERRTARDYTAKFSNHLNLLRNIFLISLWSTSNPILATAMMIHHWLFNWHSPYSNLTRTNTEDPHDFPRAQYAILSLAALLSSPSTIEWALSASSRRSRKTFRRIEGCMIWWDVLTLNSASLWASSLEKKNLNGTISWRYEDTPAYVSQQSQMSHRQCRIVTLTHAPQKFTIISIHPS